MMNLVILGEGLTCAVPVLLLHSYASIRAELETLMYPLLTVS